ncbi:MAG TPA: ScpA family protein [Acidimicrobiia bacterium]
MKTPVFEGPLDLLLQLIGTRQVDVTKVSLAAVVDDYVAVMEALETQDLEDMSEFVLVAATLLQLKARFLLPGSPETDFEEDLALLSERDRLLVRLLQSVTFKDVAAVLAYRMEEAARRVARNAGIDRDIAPSELPVELGVTAGQLADLAATALFRHSLDVETDHLDLELPSVYEAMEDVRARMVALNRATFTDLVEHCTRSVEVVAYFLAVLELARWGAVRITQDDWLSEIRVEAAMEPSPGVWK